MDHYCAAPMTEEEVRRLVMPDWECPLCGTKGHLAVFSWRCGYCIEKGVVLNLVTPLVTKETKQ